MNIIRLAVRLIKLVSGFVSKLMLYKMIFKLTGVVATRKFKKASKKHKYAILIAARNESAVIGNLIDSIRKQDYPKELLDIFVVADNCTDDTAEVARRLGANVYERTDTEHRTKGFALQYLVKCIDRDIGVKSYEAYMIFDADNLLKSDYVSRMNDSFDAGEKIVTSYRNTKNFSDNWIAASYGIHWLRTIRNEHRAKSLFRLATRIQGTGFLFSNELIENGWNYTSLTEDRAFCADAVVKGYKISYNNNAIFYDEQPVNLRVALRQRIRWAKGHLQAFAESGGKLFIHIFHTEKNAEACLTEEEKKNLTPIKRLLNNIRLRFMSFDMLMIIYPRPIFLFFKKISLLILRTILILHAQLFITYMYAPRFLAHFLKSIGVSLHGLPKSCMIGVLFLFMLSWTLDSYIKGIVTAIYIFIVEHKRIMPIIWYKKIWYCITFPIFDIIGKISMVIALFSKVEWKPIPHNAAINIDQISNR